MAPVGMVRRRVRVTDRRRREVGGTLAAISYASDCMCVGVHTATMEASAATTKRFGSSAEGTVSALWPSRRTIDAAVEAAPLRPLTRMRMGRCAYRVGNCALARGRWSIRRATHCSFLSSNNCSSAPPIRAHARRWTNLLRQIPLCWRQPQRRWSRLLPRPRRSQ